ncbi:MAG TPA: pyroglutamyl-peptidase I [Pseudolabrys sp.]|nr:pyroglutamyl-peptidase I [Pseudolabrys sp.]
MPLTILVTGFGPFPGAPFNPTASLAQSVARARRPALADVKLVAHIFPTSYAAVDRELPALIAKHRPDALLMFGLAPRARGLRVETRARNALALLPDAGGASLGRRAIALSGPASLKLRTPARLLLAALRGRRPGATLSRDAGRYLCNYLCWRAAETASTGTGPRLASFIHVPPVRRGPRRKREKALASLNDLAVAGARALVALVAAVRR